MSIAGLIQEGVDTVIGSVNQIINLGSKPYKTGDDIDKGLQSVKAKNWQYDLGYSFEVEGGGASGIGIDALGNGNFSKFLLQINPQDLQQSENFAVTVTPSQTGVVVESQGFVLKYLTISGTTGIKPVEGGRTGYNEFLLLRNYFRSYCQAKKNPNNKSFRLIFRNKKDNEHWYVEPIGPGVTLRRNANRSFLYDYAINLVITGKANERPKTGWKMFDDVLDTINDIETFIDDVSDSIQNAAELIHNSALIFKRTFKDIEITLLQPIDKISTVLQAMKYAKTTVSALPKSFYEDAKQSFVNVRDNFSDLVGLSDTQYNATYGRTPITATKALVPSDAQAMEGLSLAISAVNKILSSNLAFSLEANSGLPPSSSTNLQDAISINSSANQSKRIGSNASLTKAFKGALDFSPPASVQEVNVEIDDTLERVAYRYMGQDATKWYQIALLNNLDPPYISATPIFGKNTILPGGKILIPTFSSPSMATSLQQDDSYITKDYSPLEKSLGVDLQLTNEYDLAIDETSYDLKLLGGIPNAAQAVKIKLGLDRDALLYHPEIGVDMQIGQKTIYTAQDILAMIEASLLQDNRFDTINSIQVLREASTISLTLEVILKRVNGPVPLQVNI